MISDFVCDKLHCNLRTRMMKVPLGRQISVFMDKRESYKQYIVPTKQKKSCSRCMFVRERIHVYLHR